MGIFNLDNLPTDGDEAAQINKRSIGKGIKEKSRRLWKRVRSSFRKLGDKLRLMRSGREDESSDARSPWDSSTNRIPVIRHPLVKQCEERSENESHRNECVQCDKDLPNGECVVSKESVLTSGDAYPISSVYSGIFD